MIRNLLVLTTFAVAPYLTFGKDAVVCPEMPTAITEINRNVKSDIAVSVGSLGKVKAGEIAVKTEVEAQGLLSKYPNADRILTLQTMAATYCTMLRNSSIAESEKLDRWERFQNRILDFQKQAPVAMPQVASASAPLNKNAEVKSRISANAETTVKIGQMPEANEAVRTQVGVETPKKQRVLPGVGQKKERAPTADLELEKRKVKALFDGTDIKIGSGSCTVKDRPGFRYNHVSGSMSAVLFVPGPYKGSINMVSEVGGPVNIRPLTCGGARMSANSCELDTVVRGEFELVFQFTDLPIECEKNARLCEIRGFYITKSAHSLPNFIEIKRSAEIKIQCTS
jgi:hypothetical protein